ncbi:MAG: CPBP family intramembrane metalloprotease [Leptolyngbyaceae cyanobacterium MAG.088]|nr:CPBP family intramembrane metalloprotease [Leptolyngbyaceae cyanobacterium MAG.088]
MWQRISKALTHFPTPVGWLEVAALTLLFLIVAAITGSHLYQISNAKFNLELAVVTIVAFFVPALFEELIFRGLLLVKFNAFCLTLSLFLFVLWHPLQAYTTFPLARPVFADPTFLGLVALLGGICSFVYVRTGSLWASVFVHWMVVVAWKAAGGANFQ